MSSNNCFTRSNSALQCPMLRNGTDTQTGSRFRFSHLEAFMAFRLNTQDRLLIFFTQIF